MDRFLTPPARARTLIGQVALVSISGIIALALAGLLTIGAEGIAPANDPFTSTWARTDEPVASAVARRTWIWGPGAFTPELSEPYRDAPAGQRTVQYFDKARMEISSPAAGSDSHWHVTNGLLVHELMMGRIQLGDDTFEQRPPAQLNVAGDPADPAAPTYATFGMLTELPPREEGTPITGIVSREGMISVDNSLEQYGVTTARLIPETNHAVASVFWDFMVSNGTVLEEGQYVDAHLFENPFFATGFPLTEAYWATIEVGGTPRLTLIQAFERRVLTYTPDNPEGWRVESGNAGRHYYEWRYGGGETSRAPARMPQPPAP